MAARAGGNVTTHDEEIYVRELLAGLVAYAAYYGHRSAANAAGPDAAELTEAAKADATELRHRIEDGERVVGLRSRAAFAAGRAAATLNFGIGGNFATYLGWLIPWAHPGNPAR